MPLLSVTGYAVRRHLRRHLSRFTAAALAALGTLGTLAALSGCAVTFPTPTPPAPSVSLINGGKDGVAIPLHVERADQDHARLGLPVVLDGKPVYLALDTGTQGVRVLKSVLPGSGYPGAAPSSTLPLANGAQVAGASVKLPMSVAGSKPVSIDAQAVETVSCQPTSKRCIAMDGYTGEFGWAFSGLFGVGAAQPDDTCCTQPLRALAGHIGERYVVHANFDQPYLLLSPSGAITRDYTMVPMTVAQDGTVQWPRGCINVGDKMTFCAPLVFATATTDMIRVETDTAPNWTGDDGVGKVLVQGNYNAAIGSGNWVHRYDDAQVTVVKARPGANRIVVGLMGMQNIDVLFDFPHAQLGLRASQSIEKLSP
ncbi:hypothetical protein EN871_29485 [bacterium M00.F.Ca.ET.228.01.1.1]|uniref:hypothetical protein n=1 Tax=Paraburkholderia phenoliruptrix TaxID=252970 RepID=UPI001091D990|nr:hypothetical protein [Paraburkholderia phenoliruptrix]TGP40106.1 hypothetical protein EN871_29485 [bacterium M00.F.Ca.ET.228.01.1.1]TGR96081.1 hypothetical protein EN834_29090 [bacterium M00.F.Ca.ET.191.01.1.1]TGT97218.1 hypothetical protein EN798_29100 [bacterium M00.F.Ca.ET.155.01.1.1]MBW0448440.1 hypothetical protein [Paraburkholderia phenoliruptrix]MBW9100698.1 hypothetical protein [Paraburkholderia phenoliruptrix]